jgi:type I restriction enzyme S subunit
MSELTFGELLAEPLRNGVSYASKARGEGIRMINMREIFANDRITAAVDCELVPLTLREQQSARLERNDLLFARQSLTYDGAGKVSLVLDETLPTWDSHLIRARLDLTRAVPSFYYYFFKSAEGRRRIETIIQQVAAAGVRSSDLARLSVPVPPLSTQHGIAEVLGALDDKIAANSVLARMAEQVASLTYDAIVGSWGRTSMSQVLEPVLGGTPPRAEYRYWNEGTEMWISARDITSAPMRVVADTVEKISGEAVAETRAKPLPPGSVILTARGTVGEVGRLARSASFNQSCYGFRPDVVPPSLLYFSVLQSCERAKSLAHGSVFDTITRATFDHLTIPWEPHSAGRAEAKLAPLLGVVTQAIQENRTLAATRDALLPQLMSGNLRVLDAEAAASAAGV